jgi:signal transduction histidine kinase
LLHPPLLDVAGFGSAARWYVDGFARRSNIKVNLNLTPELGRLHSDTEIALFRAVQEALTNVHRHSGASAVDIRLSLDTKQIQLEIRDNGQGIPKKRLKPLIEGAREAGVGIAGMRERIRELGGSVEIQSDRTGTKVIVRIPTIEKASIDPNANGELGRSDKAPERGVLGLVDHTHPAATELLDNAVVRNDLADHFDRTPKPWDEDGAPTKPNS